MREDIDAALKWVRFGLEMVQGVWSALHDGKSLKDVRVSDVLSEQSQLELAKHVADAKARLKFGEAP